MIARVVESRELLDVLDEQGERTGETKPRWQVHRDGDWHRSFHLWVVREDDLVLFQRRAPGKDLEPGRIDVTVGGHFRAGEGLEQVVREVEEEIGVSVEPGDLSFLGCWRAERRYADAVDREFVEVYAIRRDAPLSDYWLDCSEVTVLYELPLRRALELYRVGTPQAASGYDCQGRVNNALLVESDLILAGRADTVAALEELGRWLERTTTGAGGREVV